ncbi:hypothetical protein BKA66DRAFT_440222 [Pyrenochaeta sp. MPI-SDFR-AT-0127]|nr:hypothetical protein BKA66DRAFT_440222 [Pyrenochaeta sp. MPI-SDFR-AT-0127]
MPPHTEANACSACARSKRRCGRQTPSCARCAASGRPCVYPPSRSRAAGSSRPLLSDALRGPAPRMADELLAEFSGITSSSATNLIPADDLILDLAFPLIDSDFDDPSSLIQTSSVPATKADWFLAPETWRISYKVDTSAAAIVGKSTMTEYVAMVRSWFERWVATGSNPFIHSLLYSANFPACVQVAYATLASYIHRTPANTDTVLHIVEERSNDLLRDYGAVPDRAGAADWADARGQDIDLFTQLARLHALMVYQIIGLFDGDIRSRYVAQGHMAVYDRWNGKLLHSAAKAFSNTQAIATQLVGCLPGPSTSLQQQWYLWILTESIRRTWVIAASISTVFTMMQQRWASCPGGIMYTNRSGLWNAASATEWEKHYMGRDVAFLHRFECVRLFDEAVPADVDEFGTAMLAMTFNQELLKQ